MPGNIKTQYYSETAVDQQAKFFLDKIIELRRKVNFRIDPTKVALLMIDFQKFFFDQSSHAFIPSANAILPRVFKLQHYCLQNNIRTIHTCHVSTKENANMMRRWWGNRLPEKGDPLVEIIPGISFSRNSTIIKSQYDAFYDSELDSVLQASGITQVIITGVMAHLCCETTARSAFVRGYEVFFSIDGTATYNQDFHLGTLTNLAHGFAVPLLIEEIMAQLKGK